MENVPLHPSHPDPIINQPSATSSRDNTRESTPKLPLVSTDLGINIDQHALFAIHNNDSMARKTQTQTQLASPPASHLHDGSSELSPSGDPTLDANGASSSRKRSRTPQPTSRTIQLDSPNPKARKQPKRLAATSSSTSGSKRKQPTNARLASVTDASHSPSRSPSSSTSPELIQKPATPPRKRTQAVPKTEKPQAKTKRATKGTRRKSEPLDSVRASSLQRKAPKLDAIIQDVPESDTDDPLLLMGTETWVPVSWKPMYFKRSTSPEIKTEVQDLNMDVFSAPPPTEVPHAEPVQLPSNEAPQIELGNIEERADESMADPAWPDLHEGSFDIGEIQASQVDMAPGRQNSLGLDVELGDESILDFEVPVRLDSPPPRRRRDSAVSRRQPTPAHLSRESDENEDRNQNTSESAVRPSTPQSQGTRNFIAPYPSPRFVGHDLGSLSPEKGRGPVRGAQPNMDSDDDEDSRPTTSQHSAEAETADTSNEGGYSNALANITNGTPTRKGLTLSEVEALYDATPRRSKSAEQEVVPASETDTSMESSEGNSSSSVDVSREDAEVDGPGVPLPEEAALAESQNTAADADESHDDRMEEDEDEQIMMQIQRELTVDVEDEDAALRQAHNDVAASTGQVETNTNNSSRSLDIADVSATVSNSGITQVLIDETEIKDEVDDVLQNSMVVEEVEQDWTDEEDDDDAPPIVEISSRNHEAAARAAAILKLHHDWIEASKRPSLKRSRSSMSLGDFDSPRSHSTPPGRPQTPVERFQFKRSALAGSPIQPALLRQVEAEVSPNKASARKLERGRFASQDVVEPFTPVHGAGPSGARKNRFETPSFKAPMIIINPASTVSSQRFVHTYTGEKEPSHWMKEDWKHLERCLLAERQNLAKQGGYLSAEDVDVEDINIDAVVEKFLEEVNFEEEDLVDEWDIDKIRRRVIALKVRHSPDPQVARSVMATPSMIVPFTPQIRLHAKHVRSTSLLEDTPTSRSYQQRSRSATATAPSVPPVSAMLLSRRYSHLYEEATAIAGLPKSTLAGRGSEPITSSDTSTLTSDPPKKSTASKIPVPSLSKQTMPPPPPPISTPKATAPPRIQPLAEDTPSATSRVLGFLGLGNILRSSTRTVSKGKGKASSAEPKEGSVPVEEGQTRVIRARVEKPAPEPIYNMETKSIDDLNHVEPLPPRLPTPPKHPKELVELHHVPIPPPQPPTSGRKPRRVSGGSVKDLVKTFEELEDENDKERRRIKEVVRRGRRVVGGDGKSLRRVASNLSTASVISASDFERSYGDESMDSSFGAGSEELSMDVSMMTDGDVSMEGIVQRRKSLLNFK